MGRVGRAVLCAALEMRHDPDMVSNGAAIPTFLLRRFRPERREGRTGIDDRVSFPALVAWR
jgi:hypothetical protein